MDLSRAVYSRDLKITAMRALDAGASTGEIARKYQLSPKLLGKRGEWRAQWKPRFPALGVASPVCPRWTIPAASPIWNVKSAS